MILQCKTYKASGVALKKIADYLRQFPQTFWVANTMEIFERMAWYGFYAVSSLYITGSKESGGLGFTDEDRGLIQAVVPFFLYLFPALTGAMADKYGFKKMLFWSFVVLTPSYFLLGQVKDFYMFFAVFMVVAFGAAMFKPVIIGTVSKTTNEKTGTVGFGIFYMMVNIGGFLGPIAAGVVRGWSWEYVFIASSFWIALNFIFVLLFFKEPPTEVANEATKKNSFLVNMVEVLGNGRFFRTNFHQYLYHACWCQTGTDGCFGLVRDICLYGYLDSWQYFNRFGTKESSQRNYPMVFATT
jgi:POT family proton-dependent oligopeptide transporter